MLDTPIRLGSYPVVLQAELYAQYGKLSKHALLQEWDNLEVDAGRFVEVVLRILEWYVSGTFTPIDGRSKPDRSRTLNAARQHSALAPSLRQQIPMLCELVLDFRNNRNAAHLGDIDPAKFDGVTVAQQCAWVMGELVRIEASIPSSDVQSVLDDLAERPASLIYELEGRPIVLSSKLNYEQVALVQLYSKKGAVYQKDLFKWSGHSHSTRWRSTALAKLVKNKEVFMKDDGLVYLLPPGVKSAEKIIKDFG